MRRLFLNPWYQSLLDAIQATGFDALLALRSQGDMIASDTGRTTHRLHLQGDYYFLKTADKPNLSAAIEAPLSLRKPHHYCWREMQQVLELQSCGIAVMDVVAAGESSRWVAPDFSFILVKEVPGDALDGVFADAAPERRRALIAELGRQAGQLHRAGFFTPVRMKDVIVTPQGEFVLIDRETRKPGARRFARRKALLSLQRTLRRESRDGAAWGEDELRLYVDAYLSALSTGLKLDGPGLTRYLSDQQ